MPRAQPGLPPSRNAVPRTCYLSRHRGWTDPEDPSRPTSEVNLLAVALDSRVWSLNTAWMSIFGTLIPKPVAEAFRKGMARVPISEVEVQMLQDVAQRLKVRLVVTD